MGKLWSSSTEAKVAIIGAFYELEQLFAASNKTGTEMKEFSTITGMSAQTLKQYEYAAQQAVGHNVELAGTFESLQRTLQKMMGPGGAGFDHLGAMINALNKGGIKVGLDEAKQWMTNVPLLMQRMHQFATLPERAGQKGAVSRIWKDYILDQMGIQKDARETLELGGFAPNKIAAAKPFVLSDNDANQITKASTAWANMHSHMELAVGQFNAKEGPEMARNLEKIVDAVIKLTAAFVKLAETLKLFNSFARILSQVGTIISGIADQVSYLQGDRSTTLMRSFSQEQHAQKIRDLKGYLTSGVSQSAIAHEMHISVQQILNFQHSGVDPFKTSASVSKANQDLGKHIAKAHSQTQALVHQN